jgi:hypothetical protein
MIRPMQATIDKMGVSYRPVNALAKKDTGKKRMVGILGFLVHFLANKPLSTTAADAIRGCLSPEQRFRCLCSPPLRSIAAMNVSQMKWMKL